MLATSKLDVIFICYNCNNYCTVADVIFLVSTVMEYNLKKKMASAALYNLCSTEHTVIINKKCYSNYSYENQKTE